jgi:hypothetical protein
MTRDEGNPVDGPFCSLKAHSHPSGGTGFQQPAYLYHIHRIYIQDNLNPQPLRQGLLRI